MTVTGSRLPHPVGRQKEVLYLPARGHLVVLGTAGSGKTTLAILRSAYLADPRTDHYGRTLLVTFNRALVAYLRHLRDTGPTDVTVENYHTFARGYLHSRGKMSRNAICGDIDRRQSLIQQAVQQVGEGYEPHPFLEQPTSVYSEEIRWMAQQGINSFEDYLEIERIGRFGTRIQRELRPVMFEIREAYRAIRNENGWSYDWDDLATAVKVQLQEDLVPRRYRHIVIDEGQDFSPEMIRSLAMAIPEDGTLTFFGDMAQQIYGHRMSWRSAGLNVMKIWEFKENYRNSRQIAKLALAIAQMPYFKDVSDIVEPVAPSADGPLPTIVKCASEEEEIRLVLDQASRAASTQTVAILFRTRSDERRVARHLPRPAVRLHRDMTTWQAGAGILYGTYHSAKGLEFDTVILPFFSTDRLPDPETIASFGDEEAAVRDGRLLYVVVTRAKTRLIMTHSGAITRMLPEDSSLFQTVNR